MRTCHVIRVLAILLLPKAFAVTHAVLPGSSIQEKVDLAQPGDIVAISGGTYPGDVNVVKAIRLVEMDGHEVTITGNVTFTGVTNAPPFEGFTVGSPAKGITVNNTMGLVIKNVDARPGFGLKNLGTSKVGVIGGQFRAIEQDGGELTVTKASITADFSTTPNSDKTVCFRTTVGGDMPWNSKASWVGYSNSGYFSFDGNDSKVVLIGSIIDARVRPINGVRLEGLRNKFQVLNCQVLNVLHGNNRSWNVQNGWNGVDYPGRGIFIQGAGNTALMANNYIPMIWSPAHSYWQENNAGDGIRSIGISEIQIYNNIVTGARYGVNAPFGAAGRNNLYFNCESADVGGVVPVNTILADPIFIAGQAPKLQPTSPCINGGITDPIFNDLDGTRNDIGPGGGCLFDPQGWTTNKPVVISFDLAPQQLLRGVDTQVNISKGLAVGQP